ncbi:hypothetical protein L798_15022 [Zootermopsis nevadensis]|uniref:Uncharacterized protein n=1 Tax=Zootermopsis nevadensis TaxID=136037 RepID=A0A067QRC0_ZOONE|nr:hypothetical protein L798_15022 [Zootermopsis nevadensis]
MEESLSLLTLIKPQGMIYKNQETTMGRSPDSDGRHPNSKDGIQRKYWKKKTSWKTQEQMGGCSSNGCHTAPED